MEQLHIGFEAFKNHVRVKGGCYYCILSTYNIAIDEFETSVYPCNSEGKITDREDVYKRWYDTRKEMIAGHAEIMTNLSDYLEGVI